MTKIPPQRLLLWNLLVFLLITVWAYRPGWFGPFLLDDPGNILRTALTQFDWAELWAQTSWENSFGLSRRLTFASFSLTHWLFGYEPAPFKIGNLLIHLCNGLLLFHLTYLLFVSEGWRSPQGARVLALAIMAIWLLHPLQVSTVLYAVQRLVLLSSLFTLLSMIAYVQGRLLMRHRPVGGFAVMFGGMLLFGLLGFMSKENAALIPLYLILIEAFFFRFRTQSAGEKRGLQLFFGAFIVVPILLALVYLSQRGFFSQGSYGTRDFDQSERLLTQAHAMWLYLKLIFIPIPGQMSLFWDAFPVQSSLDPATLLRVVGLLGMVVAGVVSWFRRSLLGFGLLFFLAAHAMESTVIPLEMVFEHRNYLALWGLAMSTILVLFPTDRMLTDKKRLGILLMLVVALSYATHVRSLTWSDEKRLFEAEYAVNPESPRVLANLAWLAHHQDDSPLAINYLRILQTLRPDHAGAFLDEVRLTCSSGALAHEALAVSQHLLGTKRINPYAEFSLAELVTEYATGRCRALDYHDLLALTRNAVANPLPASSRVRTSIRLSQVKTALLGGQVYFSTADLLSFLKTLEQEPSDYRNSVKRLYLFARMTGRTENLLAYAQELPEPHRRQVIEIFERTSEHCNDPTFAQDWSCRAY